MVELCDAAWVHAGDGSYRRGLRVGGSVGILPQAEPSVRFANMAENHGLGVFATQPDLWRVRFL